MAAWLLLANSLTGCAIAREASVSASPTIRDIEIRSQPSGADVFVIGGRVGTTPTTITERDIYPNTYKPEQQHLYGKVILRKQGCEPYSRQLTLTDIKNGLDVQLRCDERVAATAGKAPISMSPKTPETDPPEPNVAKRRLQQLRVIQQLREEGLMSPEEERRIRKRILNASEMGTD
jgi:hypothetical protein